MATGNRRSGSPELGHDAFLDVVANMVGVLIILVVVLGSRTEDVAKVFRSPDQPASIAGSSDSSQETELESRYRDLQSEVARAEQALHESQKLEQAIRGSDTEIEAAKQRRDRLLDLLEVAKRAWEDKQRELDAKAVRRGKVEAKLVAAKSQLESLQAVRAQAGRAKGPTVAVSHLPTPMAKTVFGEELHFRLKGGLLAVVPIERLLQEIRGDMRQSATVNSEGRLDSAVGPIQGFVARFEVERSRETVNQGGRIGQATVFQLTSIVFEPLNEPHGQPLDTVLANQGSLLDIELAGRTPDRTTITVWVYPDSFAEFRRLKEHLYQRGFATAARPLPTDRPIAAGPKGTKSIAQ